MNTEDEKKAKKKVTAMEVQKIYLLKHTFLFSFLFAVLQKNWNTAARKTVWSLICSSII